MDHKVIGVMTQDYCLRWNIACTVRGKTETGESVFGTRARLLLDGWFNDSKLSWGVKSSFVYKSL